MNTTIERSGKSDLPDYQDIVAAAARISGAAVRTPLIKCHHLDILTGADVWLKPEVLQRTGSFKFRGAFNAISALSGAERKAGVLAVSSGNHAQGIAEAARIHGIFASIIMPADSPLSKLERTRRSGAKVITYDRLEEDREQLAAKVREETGATFIHPFNNPLVIAGQGTAGLEICEDLHTMDKIPDNVFVCTGGGGLTAGITVALAHHFPAAVVHTCEPEGFDDYRRSLIAGKRLKNDVAGGSVCDAIVTPMPGELSFAITNGHVGPGQIVSDAEALEAVAFAFHEMKLVVEPGGAVALAAVIKAGKALQGKTVVATLSGGNVDPEVFCEALNKNA